MPDRDEPRPSSVEVKPSGALRPVLLGVLTAIAVVAGFALAYALRGVLLLLLVAIVLATAVQGFVARLQRWGLSNTMAVILAYAVLVTVVGALAVATVPFLAAQIADLIAALPVAYGSLREMLLSTDSQLLTRLASRLPMTLAAEPATETAAAGETVAVVSEAIVYGQIIAQGAFYSILVLVLAFYWSMYQQRRMRSFLLMVPERRREATRQLVFDIQSKVGGYVRGQAMVCVAVGLMSLVAYTFLGLPYAAALALVAGLLEAVPVLGPTLGAVPALLVASSLGGEAVVGVLITTCIVQAVENYLLLPRVMSHSVGVNSFITLLSIAAFGTLLGVPGAILAIPMAAVLRLLLDRLLARDAAVESIGDDRGPVSLLRYRTADLLRDVRGRLRLKRADSTPETDAIAETVEKLAQELDIRLRQAASEGLP